MFLPGVVRFVVHRVFMFVPLMIVIAGIRDVIVMKAVVNTVGFPVIRLFQKVVHRQFVRDIIASLVVVLEQLPPLIPHDREKRLLLTNRNQQLKEFATPQ